MDHYELANFVDTEAVNFVLKVAKAPFGVLNVIAYMKKFITEE